MASRSSSISRSRTGSTSTNATGINLSRVQEKEQLETLNNRLAVYIDTVRRLEQDNRELKSVIESYSDKYEVETSKVKQLYERELEDAKRLIEELAREKSRLEIDAEKANAEAQDALSKLGRKERDLRAADGRVKQYETEIGQLKAANETLGLDVSRKTDENIGLKTTNGDLEKQVNMLKRQLEAETLLRVDLENKNKTLREELQFNEQLHETAIEEIRHQRHIEVRSSDEGIRQQYDDRLLEELKDLRRQTDEEMQLIRDELATHYEKKIEDLQTTIRRNGEQLGNYRSDLASYRERIEEMSKGRDDLNNKVLLLEQRGRELEDRLHRSQVRQDEILTERDEEIRRLKEQIEQMQIDYQHLLDIKIGLDREISTYRKLLESEEERLNISGNVSRLDGSNMTLASNATFESSAHQSRKRPRYEVDDQPAATTQLIEGINIVDDDSAQPKFVKLINNSTQDVALNGHVLKRKVGSQNYEFKFPKGMVLRAGTTSTIWSSDVNDISVDPPTNLKLRTTKWFSGSNENKRTTLEDSDGRVIAERTVMHK